MPHAPGWASIFSQDKSQLLQVLVLRGPLTPGPDPASFRDSTSLDPLSPRRAKPGSLCLLCTQPTVEDRGGNVQSSSTPLGGPGS